MADISREDLNKLINDAMNEINNEKEEDDNVNSVVDTDGVKENVETEPTPEPEVKTDTPKKDDNDSELSSELSTEHSNEPFEFLGASITLNDEGTQATITKDGVTKTVDVKSKDLKDVFESVQSFFEDFVKETNMETDTEKDLDLPEKDSVSENDTENNDVEDDFHNDDELNELEKKLNDEDLDLELDNEEDELDYASVSASSIISSSMDELYKRYGNKIEELIELGLETKNAVLSSISDLTQKKPISVLSSKISALKTEKETNSKKEVNVTKKYLLAKKVNKNVHNALNLIVASLKTINNNSNSFSPAQMENEIKNVKILAEQFINSKTPETILASCVSIENNDKSLNDKLSEYKKQKEAVIAKRIEKNKVNNVVSNKIVHKNLERTVLNERDDGMEEMFDSIKNLIR